MKKAIMLALVALTLTLGTLAEAKQVAGVVNLNTASVEQLMLLPGVGRSKAEAILSYRKSHPFKAPEELTEVRGIGEKMFRKIEGYLAVQGATTLQEVTSRDADQATQKK